MIFKCSGELKACFTFLFFITTLNTCARTYLPNNYIFCNFLFLATHQHDHLSTSNTLVNHDFQDILPNQTRAMSEYLPEDDKPLIDFCTTQFQDVFSPNLSINTSAQSYQLPLTQGKPGYFSPQSSNHCRTFSSCQSSFPIALPLVDQQYMPLQNVRQNWNPFQPLRLPQASTINPNGNSNDLSTSWQLQVLYYTNGIFYFAFNFYSIH